MFEILGTLLTGVLSGGATGLIGVLLQRYFDHKSKAQDIEKLKLQLDNAKELAKIEGERSTRVAELDMEARFAEADADVMEASFKHDAASYSSPEAGKRAGFSGALVTVLMAIVDAARGLLRPGMTAYLCWLTTVMFFWVRELADTYGLKLTAEQVMGLMLQIIATILYVFVTCTTWWFGARPPKKNG